MKLLCMLAAAAVLLPAQTRTLDIYWIDVEGGASTLIVAPSGESLLVDTGFPGNDDRDAKRIQAAAAAAGLTRIDNLVITHFHGDHVGGVAALSKAMPIRKIWDHGESIEASQPNGATLWKDYLSAAGNRRTVVKPGDKIPLAGVDITVVSANGEVIAKPINHGSANKLCEGAERKPTDNTENSRSTGFLLTYGKFTFLDVGDLTWDREMMLACPVNKVGQVTLMQATHHGFSNGQSGAPALIWSLKPQVVVVNNGARKGFSNGGYETLAKIPGIEGIWQGHKGAMNDADHNTSADMIANLDEGAADQGNWIKASISKEGKFTVTNNRNKFSKTYTAR
ncbi:MAG TPA: MBL fold metallo-hydrolase [Bryobacteraceae bacterium]|nr:MBL fold metallo-hydrolase [Bryobacteraceae bacterium]